VEEALRLRKAGQRPPQHIANGLYIEWFSQESGRVVLEGTGFSLSVTEPAWTPAVRAIEDDGGADEPEREDWREDDDDTDFLSGAADGDDDPDWSETDEHPMDEFEWERMMRESDRVTDKYSELMEKYAEHPDRDKLVAREMGWTWIEEAMSEDVMDLLSDEESDEDLSHLPDPDPAREGIDWIRTDTGRVTHPLCHQAHQVTMQMWHYCDDRGLLGEDGDEALHDMLFQSQTMCAKLSGALNSLAYDCDVEGGFVVACLKRSLKYFRSAMAAADRVRTRNIVDVRRLDAFRNDLFEIREETLRLMKHFRERI
jgi:hypothetical protein